MRGERFSPARLGGPILCPAQRLRDRLPVAAVVAGLLWGANRPAGVSRRVRATLFHDGTLDRGQTQGETRTVTGLLVVNDGPVAVSVSVEDEADHENVFGATIQPGETVNVATTPIIQTWNTARMGGLWDGINIRWKVPA